jgi:FkbH-like protein
MVLRLKDISVFVANWENKVDNINHIQHVLNIGFDSIVFLDDNAFEREMVQKAIPDITVPDLPVDPVDYLPFVKSLNLFETTSFSEADKSRTEQYQEEAKRTVYQKAFVNEDEYLQSLKMKSIVTRFNKFNTPRIAQLSQRSNQFNLRTVRYSEEEITKISETAGFYHFAFSLKDKFGDSGLIAAVILEAKKGCFFIDTWIMSCRVLKKGMEQFVLNTLIDCAKTNGVEKLVGEFIPTKKNGIVKNHYKDLGFSAENGLWHSDVNDFKKMKTFIDEL